MPRLRRQISPVRTHLSHKRARELFNYDRWSGSLTWATNHSARARAGDEAGHIDKSGRVVISLNHRFIQAARLIWLWMTPPVGTQEPVIPARLAFLNGNPQDLRWKNIVPETTILSNSPRAIMRRADRQHKRQRQQEELARRRDDAYRLKYEGDQK